jgi:hypothetical protein
LDLAPPVPAVRRLNPNAGKKKRRIAIRRRQID